MATAHPMHLNLTSWMMLFSMRSVIRTVSLSSGLGSMALADWFSMLPAFRGLAKCSRICSLYKGTPWPGLKNRVYDMALLMSAEFYSKVAEFARQRKYFAVATIVRVEGSSSAKPGSKAIIDEHGKIAFGWVGGGCAEGTVRNEALKCIELRRPEFITLDMTDELLVGGMPCGAKTALYIEQVLPQPEPLIL